jgi:hypothetical protein
MVVQQMQHLVLLGLLQLLALVLLNPLQVAVICALHPRSTCCYIVYYYNSIYCTINFSPLLGYFDILGCLKGLAAVMIPLASLQQSRVIVLLNVQPARTQDVIFPKDGSMRQNISSEFRGRGCGFRILIFILFR